MRTKRNLKPLVDACERRDLLSITINPIADIHIQENGVAATQVTTIGAVGAVAFAIDVSSPVGARIDPVSGVFTWVTPFVQEVVPINVIASDSNGQASTSFQAWVYSNPPNIQAGVNQSFAIGGAFLFNRSGSFTEADVGDTFAGNVNFGDGTGTELLTIGPGNTFQLSHVFKLTGNYIVQVKIVNSQGAQGYGAFLVTVNQDANIPSNLLTGAPATVVNVNQPTLAAAPVLNQEASSPALVKVVDVSLAKHARVIHKHRLIHHETRR